MLILLDYKQSCREGCCSNGLIKAFLFLVVVIFALSIGFSRLLLGVHSLYQIVFGYALGLWVTFTMHFCVKDDLFAHLETLMNQAKPSATQYKKYAYITFCTFLFVNGLSIIDYTIFTLGFVEIRNDWLK